MNSARRCLPLLLLGVASFATLVATDSVQAKRPGDDRIIDVSPALQIRELQPGIWLHTSWQVLPGGTRYPANGLIVREGDSLILVDTAWGEAPTTELLTWIERTLRLPVSHAVITHAHDDRIGGIRVLVRHGIPTLSHPLTSALATTQGLPSPQPLQGLNRPGDSVRVGLLEVYFPGAGHTRDNITVWIPAAHLLFGGCLVKDAGSRDLGNTSDADCAAWPEAIRRLQERYPEAATIVPGHGAPGGQELLRHTLALCRR